MVQAAGACLGVRPKSGHIGQMSAPLVFDRALVRRRLARAITHGYANFLLHRAIDDLDERLGTVLRRFPVALDLATPTGDLAAWLAASGRADAVLRLATVMEEGNGRTILGDPEALPVGPEQLDLVVS